MDLTVVVDGYDPDDSLAVAVPGHQHRSGLDLGGIASIAQDRPAEPLVILGVEVGYQVDLRVAHTPPSV